jgi:hypothetical protein
LGSPGALASLVERVARRDRDGLVVPRPLAGGKAPPHLPASATTQSAVRPHSEATGQRSRCQQWGRFCWGPPEDGEWGKTQGREKFGGAPVVGRIDLKRTADEAAEVPRVKGLGDTQCQI